MGIKSLRLKNIGNIICIYVNYKLEDYIRFFLSLIFIILNYLYEFRLFSCRSY